jgi:CNT family concentrative nucleoside transporter
MKLAPNQALTAIIWAYAGFHLLLAALMPLVAHEAHYALYARHLSLSYLDHPPLAVWLQAPVVWLSGSDFTLRLLPVGLSVLAQFLLAAICRQVYPDRSPWLPVIAVQLLQGAIVFHGSMTLSPDAPLLPIALGVVLVVLKLQAQLTMDPGNRGAVRSWLLLGLLIGLAGLSKYTAVTLPLSIVLVMTATRGIRGLALPGLWLAGLLALLLIRLPVSQALFAALNQVVLVLQEATTAGTSFVFGYLGGADFPVEGADPSSTFVLAFKALPLVIVVSALSALLFYWGVLPWVVQRLARLLARSMGIGGALGLGAAANIFVGMIEAPLLVRPYLAKLSRAELFALMTTGMATIAGTMMVLYATILSGLRDDALGHILAASVISIPAALVMALLLVPGAGETTEADAGLESEASSAMDAITRGTLQGVTLVINIVAMLIVFVALVALINLLLGLLPEVGGEPLSLQRLLGLLFAPLVWLMGIPFDEALTAGSLMGIKTILNEFLAYLELAALPRQALSERSEMIMIYALCGFANFGSLGIMLGGMGTMVPERRAEIAALGLKSILAGTLATLMTGAWVGVLAG